MLKLIPRENPSQSNSQPSKKIKNRTIIIPKLQQKLNYESKEENQIVTSTYLRLVHYMKKEGNYTLKEMADLIHSLQRSVLSLERKRTKILRVQQRRKDKSE